MAQPVSRFRPILARGAAKLWHAPGSGLVGELEMPGLKLSGGSSIRSFFD